jgi:hypothetical protein
MAYDMAATFDRPVLPQWNGRPVVVRKLVPESSDIENETWNTV